MHNQMIPGNRKNMVKEFFISYCTRTVPPLRLRRKSRSGPNTRFSL
jgi:hypothetical protein